MTSTIWLTNTAPTNGSHHGIPVTRAVLSPIRLSMVVCLSFVVCNAGAPYSAGWNFQECFFAVWYFGHHCQSWKILRRSSQGTPRRDG